MGRKRGILVAAAFAAASTTMPGIANASASHMPTGGPTTQPIGHYEFCQRNPGECSGGGAISGPVELSRDLWATLIEVNNRVNANVRPLTDYEIWGVEERWTYPRDGVGDCEDFALAKQRMLVEEGVPLGNLLITVVRQPNGDGHAVLTVRTSLGDFVLDNVEPRVLAWNETRYEYLKHQSEGDPGAWVAVEDDRGMLVGSVNSE